MKRIGTFLLALMLALAVPAPCFAAVDEKTVEAPSAVLVSADTGAVLFEKNAHDRRSPASVTKLMTMLLVAEALDTGKIKLTDTVTGSANAASKGRLSNLAGSGGADDSGGTAEGGGDRVRQ